MDVGGLVGLDSISSLDQDNNILSARSNSSLSSMEDVLAGHSSRKKKSSTLSRLKKLKKQVHVPGDVQEVGGLASSPLVISNIKDLTAPQLEKHVNGNVTDVQGRADETKESLDSRVQDGKEGISSLLSKEREVLQKKPSPSPRIKPRRIRPLDGTLDGSDDGGQVEGSKHNHSKFESQIGLSPLARLPRVTMLDGGSDIADSLIKNGKDTVSDSKSRETSDANSNSVLRIEPRPSPRVKPRRLVNLEEDMVGNDARTIATEWTEKHSALSEEWSIVQDEHKTKDSGLSDSSLKPVSLTLDKVSMLPALNLSKKTLNDDNDEHLSEQQNSDDRKQTEDNSVLKPLPTEQTIVPQSSEIVCNEPTHLKQGKTSNEHSEEIAQNKANEDASFDEDSDSEDLIVIPDNSATKTSKETNENISSSLTEAVRRSSGDGQSNPIDEATSSLSSLTDVSKLLSPLNASTPTKTSNETNNLKVMTNFKSSLQSLDGDDNNDEEEEEDIVVSTFSDKRKGVVEESIIPTQNPKEELVFKCLSSRELVAELNNLSEDGTLRAHSESVGAGISDTTLRGDGETDKESGEQSIIQQTVDRISVEAGGQTKLVNQSRDDRPSPLILETLPPPLSSTSDVNPYKRDNIDNSVALSEPILGSASQLSEPNRSFMSTGALSTITTKTARNRSYLSGGASTTGSLMSKDELERFFPDRKVRIFMATWNMCEGKVLPDNLDELLLPEDCVLVQDMYVIGTQESSSDGQEWEIRLQETLGPSHVLLHSATHGVLRLLIFIRRDLIWFCSVVEDDAVSTRAFSMIKTKGAVAAGFTFFGTSFLLINAHFTAGDEQIKERIADYEKIIRELQLPSKVPPTKKYNNLNNDITSRFDCIFWCGDFNFRLSENRTKIENWAGKLRDGKDDDYEILLRHDQLKKNMAKKSIFRGFQEGEIEFLPTYKYDIGGDIYDTSTKARVPSYTDRVLFKSRRSAQIRNVLYNACNSIKMSDHKPVYAMFEVKIRPGKDDSLTSGGMFSREVFMEANKRRANKAAMSGTVMSQKSSTICSVM